MIFARLRKLALWKKIVAAVVVAVLFGVVGYLLFGSGAGGLASIFAVFAAWAGLSNGEQSLADQVKELAARDRAKAEMEVNDVRSTAEAAAKRFAAERAIEAERAARAAGADDGGDPNRVLDRHSSGGGTWSGSD